MREHGEDRGAVLVLESLWGIEPEDLSPSVRR